MPVDPNIALNVRPTQGMGPSLAQIISNASGLVQFDQQKQDIGAQNALKGILGTPGAVDENGNPTGDTMSKIMSVAPEYGMKLKQNALNTMQQQMQMKTAGLQQQSILQSTQLKRTDALNDLFEPMREETYKIYQTAPGDEAARVAAAQKVWTERINGLKTSGQLSQQEADMLPTDFNPGRILSNSPALQKQIAEQQKLQFEQDKDTRADRHLTEEERHNKAMEGKETPAAAAEHDARTIAAQNIDTANQDRQDKGLPPLTTAEEAKYRQDARLAPKIQLDKEKRNSPIELSDDQLQTMGAQLAAGQSAQSILPGYRGDMQATRLKIQSEAVRQIRQENPDMTPAQAGEELALRQIEYGGEKRSAAQLETMLGATRPAIGQLDYNIDQVKEDLKGLASSDISPVINAIVRGEQKWTGDPAYSQLFFHMHAVGVESARILSGGQASIAQLNQGAAEEAQKWANVNMTPASFEGVAKSMHDEGKARIQGFADAIQAQKHRHTSGAENAPAGATGGGAPPPASTGGLYTGDKPPAKYPDAKKAPDGNWYIPPKEPGGKYLAVEADGAPAKPAAASTAAPAKADGKTAQTGIKVTDPAEAAKLPAGTWFIAPDGTPRQRHAAVAPSAPTN